MSFIEKAVTRMRHTEQARRKQALADEQAAPREAVPPPAPPRPREPAATPPEVRPARKRPPAVPAMGPESAARAPERSPRVDAPVARAAAKPSWEEPESRDPSARKRSAVIDIDMSKVAHEGYLSSQRASAEEYRRVKRPLLSVAFGSRRANVADGNLIMVTSALPGDGKTFTSVNLALSMCKELDRTVLLVDADVSKAHISRLFSAGDRPGLTDWLIDDDLDLSEVLLRVNVPGRLTFLPAGRRNAQATELLASEKMEALAREVGSRYPDRVIVFDSPPLLATTEAQVLSSLVGQVLVVVQAGGTPQHAVTQALDSLDQSKAISLVLNKSDSMFQDYYDAYYGDD